MERFATWTPYPVRYTSACTACGSLDLNIHDNKVAGHYLDSEATCRDCGANAPDELPVCTGCCETEKRCDCAAECPCEQKGALYDWEGHAVMACPVHGQPQTT